MSADRAAIVAELEPAIRPIDLGDPRSIHIIGVGGAGMRAIARILIAMGHHVSGSDQAASSHLDELAALGVEVHVGHAPANMRNADFVTRSTAIPDDNAEVAAANANGVSVYSRAEILAAIVATRPAILVAGTHGKTTTSSMLAVLLDHAGLEPSFVIGSDVGYFGTGARWGPTEHFVVEADESDGTFLSLAGAHAIVTSLDPDHLDFYGSSERLSLAFHEFVERVPGVTAVCIDDTDTDGLVTLDGVVTYGTADRADLRIEGIQVSGDATEFDVTWKGDNLGRVVVGLPGRHNALNAAGALTIALSLDIDFATASAGLARFAGVARRYEPRGAYSGIHLVDDYAHLPTEVRVAIETARLGPWNRVIAAYQPHRFSRTQALGASFAESFRGVDHLVLTDIYPSGEAPRPGITGRIVYDAVVAACPELSVSWQPTLDDVADHLAATLGPGDLCLTLGAGDLTTVPDAVLERLRAQSTVDVDWLRELEPDLGDSSVAFDAPIGPLTTYRVGGAARALAIVATAADLVAILQGARRTNTPVIALGKGSNMLVADRGIQALVVVLTGEFDEIIIDGTRVTLGAAVSLPAAARQLARHGLTGFEWAVGVPGTIGGAVTMNAGGHGSNMAATVTRATVADLTTGELRTRSVEDLDFGYRQSSIRRGEIVLDVTMQLAPGYVADAEDELREIVRWRRANQPGGQNAGSVFTNPAGDSAGRLIDAAGGKGLRVRTAQVSTKHANFIQVDPDGSADDVRALMHLVIDLVRDHAGIVLHPETHMIGFEADA